MTYYCALCGRRTIPAVFMAGAAVGPKCAAKAGLIARAREGKGALKMAPSRAGTTRGADPLTPDLFDA